MVKKCPEKTNCTSAFTSLLQMHERGDYMITDKGLKILQGLQDIYSSLQYSPLQIYAENIIRNEKKIQT